MVYTYIYFSLLGEMAILEDVAAGVEQSPLMVGTGYATNFVIALIFRYFTDGFGMNLNRRNKKE